MDEERGSRDQDHEKRPRPARRTVRQRPLWGQKLRGAEADRGESQNGVKTYDRRGVQERVERHTSILAAEAGSYQPRGRGKRGPSA